MLFGIACVVAVSPVFLAVGRSEDARARGGRGPAAAADPHEGEAARRTRPRPPLDRPGLAADHVARLDALDLVGHGDAAALARVRRRRTSAITPVCRVDDEGLRCSRPEKSVAVSSSVSPCSSTLTVSIVASSCITPARTSLRPAPASSASMHAEPDAVLVDRLLARGRRCPGRAPWRLLRPARRPRRLSAFVGSFPPAGRVDHRCRASAASSVARGERSRLTPVVVAVLALGLELLARRARRSSGRRRGRGRRR